MGYGMNKVKNVNDKREPPKMMYVLKNTEHNEVIAWTDNEYVMNAYYQNIHCGEDDVEIVAYECTHVDMAIILREEYDMYTISSVLGTMLHTKSSISGKCYAICKKNSEATNPLKTQSLSDMDRFLLIYKTLERPLLTIVPIIRYLTPSVMDIILEVIMTIRSYVSERKIWEYGFDSDHYWSMIDVVYFWKFIMESPRAYMSISQRDSIDVPLEAIFIETS